jgi:hypothetical protein
MGTLPPLPLVHDLHFVYSSSAAIPGVHSLSSDATNATQPSSEHEAADLLVVGCPRIGQQSCFKGLPWLK